MEAAQLDGATPFQTYLKIVRPNLSSVVAAVIVLVLLITGILSTKR